MCVYVCVCAHARERERERESLCVCVRESESERDYVNVRAGARECVREGEEEDKCLPVSAHTHTPTTYIGGGRRMKETKKNI
jgi:hypothetical protein